MARPPLKEREATVTIVAYDAKGNVLDSLSTFSRMTPSIQVLEFMMDTEARYPFVQRYEINIAY